MSKDMLSKGESLCLRLSSLCLSVLVCEMGGRALTQQACGTKQSHLFGAGRGWASKVLCVP